MSQALATTNQTDQRENYCKLLIWWKSPAEVNDQELLRKFMNLGTWDMWQWAWKHFTKESFVTLFRGCTLWGLFQRVLVQLASSPIDLPYPTNSQK